jgi:tRNA pseudouridine38-40 synthase
MRFLKLTIAYDGTELAGWQWQPVHRTVQGELEAAIEQVTGEQTRIAASGRTDAGVHAIAQVVSWTTDSELATDVLLRALNANTPRDIVVKEVLEAPDGFHAIEGCVSKRYRYLLYDNPIRDVFARNYVWQIWQHLEVDAMHEAAQTLRGQHDFKSYETSGSPRVSTIRDVREILVERRTFELAERIVVEVEADGFLYNMVRNIVGTLVEVGRGRQTIAWPAEVLAEQDRRVAGATAPPQGLYLVKVNYAAQASDS